MNTDSCCLCTYEWRGVGPAATISLALPALIASVFLNIDPAAAGEFGAGFRAAARISAAVAADAQYRETGAFEAAELALFGEVGELSSRILRRARRDTGIAGRARAGAATHLIYHAMFRDQKV